MSWHHNRIATVQVTNTFFSNLKIGVIVAIFYEGIQNQTKVNFKNNRNKKYHLFDLQGKQNKPIIISLFGSSLLSMLWISRQ